MNMGLGTLGSEDTLFKQKNRWLFTIDGVVDNGASVLPPLKSSRPSLSFKEIEAQHLNETIYYPGKPEWKPITLTLYDFMIEGEDRGDNVWTWITTIYDAQQGLYNPSCGSGALRSRDEPLSTTSFKKNCTLELYDGCGNNCESWTFEQAWPQSIEWGELDMSDSAVLTIDIVLRYDRAYKNIAQEPPAITAPQRNR